MAKRNTDRYDREDRRDERETYQTSGRRTDAYEGDEDRYGRSERYDRDRGDERYMSQDRYSEGQGYGGRYDEDYDRSSYGREDVGRGREEFGRGRRGGYGGYEDEGRYSTQGGVSRFGDHYGQGGRYGGDQYGQGGRYGDQYGGQGGQRGQGGQGWQGGFSDQYGGYGNQGGTGGYSGRFGGSHYGQDWQGGQQTWGGQGQGGFSGQGWQGSQGMGQGARGQHYGKGPKGYQRSDERIREEVSDRLMEAWDVDASDIEVQVSGGEVTLTGTVTDRQQKRRAEEIAEMCTGVRDVQNNIRVKQQGQGQSDTTSQAEQGGQQEGGERGSRGRSQGQR
ncbi:BON domain protein [Calidithermus terrae]|uniref:BON domain protein n=1 Tax=Calidithermus terrae TaxID=1408545 RepID=A0A399ER67_9DEIN|nr:BON domain-containing protein [Calidithermus terrae]RIH85529.1 BON domain protein [Calidithermus terrae]